MSQTLEHVRAFLRSIKISCSRSTYNNYKDRFRVFEQWLNGRAIRTPIFDDYKNFLIQSGRSRHTVRIYYSTLRSAYSWAVNTGRISRNPVPMLMHFPVPQPPEKQTFSQEDLDKVLAVMPEKWKLLTLLAYHTGQRLADLACLKWGSLDLIKGEMSLTPQKTSRFGKKISVPIPISLSTRLSQWADQCPGIGEGDPVFPTFCQSYSKFQHRWLSAAFIDYCKQAGLTMSFHCLRHTFVTRLSNSGVSPIVISSMTGHSLKQIMSYAHVDMDTKRKALYDERRETEIDGQSLPLPPVAQGAQPQA